MGGSPRSRDARIAPPKQQSIPLNQHAIGLSCATSIAPAIGKLKTIGVFLGKKQHNI